MRRRPITILAFLLTISCASLLALSLLPTARPALAQNAGGGTQGALAAVNSRGEAVGNCPLKRTNVKAEISGFLSRVRVTQEFENPFKEKIEAVYTFPLPQAAAVDDMTMQVGDRTVRGRILRREEAQAVYEAAKTNGQVASLLDQERPNIFTQSVANIMPGEKVTVEISYVETLKYEDGTYEFTFPMVVGPRYIPGAATGRQGTGTSPDTNKVPDASRITPPVMPEGMRAGHDISLEVMLDAGVSLDGITSKSHEIDVDRRSASSALVRLKNRTEIPNRDFTLRYDVAGKLMSDAVLTHRGGRGGFFTMILQPPERVSAEDVTPKELVFVLDTSGSMNGFPIEKAKETMKLALDSLYPQDTFNLITFAGDTHVLFEKPVPATPENMRKAQAFLASRTGGGGTEMMKAIRTALDPSDAQNHVRIVCFMTDGYVGNDMEIIGEVQKHPNARVFAFGIGSSVNRYLLDKMAEEGRGEVEYVSLNEDGSRAARRFHERVRNPLLTDISVDWAGLPVADVYPKRIPDLFGAKPVMVTGRYTGHASGTVKLRGKINGREVVREIPVNLPEADSNHDVLATLWARTRIDDLMSKDYNGAQQGAMKDGLQETITQLGLEYRLMTQFTSFVAVEEVVVTDGGQPRRVEVPVELPAGVSNNAAVDAVAEFGANNTVTMRAGTNTTTGQVQQLPVQTRNSPASVVGLQPGVTSGSGTGQGAGGAAGRGTGGKVKVEEKTARKDSSQGFMVVDGADKANEAAYIIKDDEKLTPEQQRQRELVAKMHPSIAAVISRLLSKGAQPTADEQKFVREGKAEIQVMLSDKTPEAMEELKQLGFEVLLDPKTSRLVIGRIAVEKLSALAELKSVRYIAPQMKR
ncbi:MAG TPA: VIT and VWA domain-containing protein [Pyrinomonadaceae bacterium]|nr:VIT and VWA domain-containing protein [Pyrinomonadaceae bacterium]